MTSQNPPLWLKLFHLLPPETSHHIALSLLSSFVRFAPSLASHISKTYTTPSTLLDPSSYLPHALHAIKNPIGLAAGFDKNALHLHPLSLFGFGFIEAGSVTLHPQNGNPKPRLFRIPSQQALINRMGFNNNGMLAFQKNITSHPLPHSFPLGINIGINKNTSTPLEDISTLITHLGSHAHYLVLNISSPNTPSLRKLQNPKALQPLLETALQARNALPRKPLLLVKIAPDLSDKDIINLVDCACAFPVDGFIATNTTLSRKNLGNLSLSLEKGGLSGKPLLSLANHTLRVLASHIRSHHHSQPLLIIGTGGISSALDVYSKLRLGAHLVQIYSSLVYQGPILLHSLQNELVHLIKQDGFYHIKDVIGVDL